MNEEDIQNKFVKWSLKAARKDELSVEAARDSLNELLARECSEETLKEYKIRLPISQQTAWRWMQVRRRASNERARGSAIASLASRPLYFVCPRTFRASARPSVVCDCAARLSNLPLKPTHVVYAHCVYMYGRSRHTRSPQTDTPRTPQACSIYRDKFQQSYYNDKHQDEAVIADRNKYIAIMDELMLRQPLWLQLSKAEFDELRGRLPDPGMTPLVHEYDDGEKYEVHVDLDDSFDERRASLPLGGDWSVRGFDGGPRQQITGKYPLPTPPDNLPDPGADLGPPPENDAGGGVQREAGPSAAAPDAAPAAAPAAAGPAAAPPLPRLAEVDAGKVTVPKLRAALQALGLNTSGLKPALQERLGNHLRAQGEASDDESEGEDQQYAVKKILDMRIVVKTDANTGSSFPIREFKVLWDFKLDTGVDEESWEPEANLAGSEELVFEYLEMQPKEPNCKYGHVQGVCRCQRPLIHTGQASGIKRRWTVSAPVSEFRHQKRNPAVNRMRASSRRTRSRSTSGLCTASAACERRPMAPARWCLASRTRSEALATR